MERLIIILTFLALSFTAAFAADFADAPINGQTYTCTVGTKYVVLNDVPAAIPLDCTITIGETGASLAYSVEGDERVYLSRRIEVLSDGAWAFKGFYAVLPTGEKGYITSAGIVDDGVVMVVFQPESGGPSHTYPFKR